MKNNVLEGHYVSRPGILPDDAQRRCDCTCRNFTSIKTSIKRIMFPLLLSNPQPADLSSVIEFVYPGVKRKRDFYTWGLVRIY